MTHDSRQVAGMSVRRYAYKPRPITTTADVDFAARKPAAASAGARKVGIQAVADAVRENEEGGLPGHVVGEDLPAC